MEQLENFWTWVYILGISSFYVLVLVIIPLGFLDLLRLFRHLSNGDEKTCQRNDIQ